MTSKLNDLDVFLKMSDKGRVPCSQKETSLQVRKKRQASGTKSTTSTFAQHFQVVQSRRLRKAHIYLTTFGRQGKGVLDENVVARAGGGAGDHDCLHFNEQHT